MPSALNVARRLVQLAAAEEELTPITNLQLQKLLYYVQGWSYAVRDQPMFDDRMEAWTYGPVVPSVYLECKRNGRDPIPVEEFSEPTGISDVDDEIIRYAWESCRGMSAIALHERTHREPPWKDARAGLAPDTPSSCEIPHEAVRRYFRELFEEQRRLHGVSPADVARGWHDERPLIPMEEIFKA